MNINEHFFSPPSGNKMKSKAVFLKQKSVHVKCQGFLVWIFLEAGVVFFLKKRISLCLGDI